ncbi:hypothetical protein IG631_06726 [Alternaria alternata]|nr:hypothetical protein IG631_06726 [Alternaria alternata]
MPGIMTLRHARTSAMISSADSEVPPGKTGRAGAKAKVTESPTSYYCSAQLPHKPHGWMLVAYLGPVANLRNMP